MLQLPAATSVSVLPLTVQTLDVVEVNVTGRPELALATSVGGAVPSVWLPGETKVMVCDPGATLNERTTGVAAAKTALPAWPASTVQVPAASSASVLPLTVQTLFVVEVKDTAKPEVEVADSNAGVTPRVWFPGELKVMVWVAFTTAKLFVTEVAAA